MLCYWRFYLKEVIFLLQIYVGFLDFCVIFFIMKCCYMLLYHNHVKFFCITFLQLYLKAHRQISRKRFFWKYCSCDKAWQFSALQGTPWRSYLENPTIDNKFINKRIWLFIHQTCVYNVFRRKELLGRHNKDISLNSFAK